MCTPPPPLPPPPHALVASVASVASASAALRLGGGLKRVEAKNSNGRWKKIKIKKNKNTPAETPPVSKIKPSTTHTRVHTHTNTNKLQATMIAHADPAFTTPTKESTHSTSPVVPKPPRKENRDRRAFSSRLHNLVQGGGGKIEKNRKHARPVMMAWHATSPTLAPAGATEDATEDATDAADAADAAGRAMDELFKLGKPMTEKAYLKKFGSDDF